MIWALRPARQGKELAKNRRIKRGPVRVRRHRSPHAPRGAAIRVCTMSALRNRGYAAAVEGIAVAAHLAAPAKRLDGIGRRKRI
jgi:hypothetical protein